MVHDAVYEIDSTGVHDNEGACHVVQYNRGPALQGAHKGAHVRPYFLFFCSFIVFLLISNSNYCILDSADNVKIMQGIINLLHYSVSRVLSVCYTMVGSSLCVVNFVDPHLAFETLFWNKDNGREYKMWNIN